MESQLGNVSLDILSVIVVRNSLLLRVMETPAGYGLVTAVFNVLRVTELRL
jgi:hypothetical protein